MTIAENEAFNKLYPNWDDRDIIGFKEQQEAKSYVSGYNAATKDQDELMIEFAEWVSKNKVWQINGFRNTVDSPKELLELFKESKNKDKGSN